MANTSSTTGMLFPLLPLCLPVPIFFVLPPSSAYCSDDCQGRDAVSPSISSSSSALSSPHLVSATGAEVPPLIPSALGSALKNIRTRGDPYSVPSSASSATWSSTEDDDDAASFAIRADYLHPDASCDPGQDGLSKQFASPYPSKPSALQYARRPSGVNNHSTVPHVHRRMSSNSSSPSGHVRGIPQSAPHTSHSSTEDDEFFSDLGLSSRDNLDTEESDVPSEKGSDGDKAKQVPDKMKRPRNRASLPAYFSLLQTNSSGNEPRWSPVSSSSGRTVARPSPPTPKMAFASRPQNTDGHPSPSVHTTPRGRRRVPGASNSTRRSDSSFSPPHSRARQPDATEALPRLSEQDQRFRFLGKDGGDWASAPDQPSRGRATFRRNSSPPPKVLLGIEDRGRTLAAARQAEIFDRSQSRNSAKPRGRARVEDLEGMGFSPNAPGLGYGRTGLIGRERDRERERSLGFVARIPL